MATSGPRSGPSVVFLHGLVGLNDHWEGVVDRVRGRLRCVMLELPLLDLRDDDCSITGVKVLTTRFLSSHVPGPVVLVGNSFGGHVALRIALEEPAMVRALVLAGSSGLAERTMFSRVTAHPTRDWLALKIAELFFDPAVHLRESDVDRAHAVLSTRAGARAMVRLSRSARSDHMGQRISGVRAPTLLLWGREDAVTPPEAAAEFLERLPNARIEWFDRCGHAPMIERPAEFARALLSFVERLEAGEAPR